MPASAVALASLLANASIAHDDHLPCAGQVSGELTFLDEYFKSPAGQLGTILIPGIEVAKLRRAPETNLMVTIPIKVFAVDSGGAPELARESRRIQ